MDDDVISAWADSVRDLIESNSDALANGRVDDWGQYLGVVGRIRGLNESLILLKNARDAKLKEQGDDE